MVLGGVVEGAEPGLHPRRGIRDVRCGAAQGSHPLAGGRRCVLPARPRSAPRYFIPCWQPTDEETAPILAQVHARVQRLLRRRGSLARGARPDRPGGRVDASVVRVSGGFDPGVGGQWVASRSCGAPRMRQRGQELAVGAFGQPLESPRWMRQVAAQMPQLIAVNTETCRQ